MPLAAPEIDVRVLGPLEVWVRRARIGLGGHKPRAVLAILLLHVNEVVSTDHLIDALWGERPPAKAQATLRVYLSRLRASLQAAAGDDAPPLLVSQPPGYVLSLPPDATDAARFEALLAAGTADLPDRPLDASAHLHAALDLWRGPAFAEFTYDDFAAQEIARLEELRLVALGSRIDADLRRGEHGGLVAELQSLTRQHPAREALHAQLMRVLAAEGRRPEALQAYERAAEVVMEEFGVEPGPELTALRALLRESPADGATDPGRVTPPPAPALGDDVPADMSPPATHLPLVPTRFVGRGAEVATVAGMVACHRLVTVVGTGGSGKTRLALEVASDAAARPGRRVLFVELADTAPASLATTVALGLGVRPEGHEPIVDLLVHAWAGHQTLLVLDNCEHVIAEIAALVSALLSRCDGLAVLATSRQPLAVRGRRFGESRRCRCPSPTSAPSEPPWAATPYGCSSTGARRSGPAWR